jgi:hypothetical protein
MPCKFCQSRIRALAPCRKLYAEKTSSRLTSVLTIPTADSAVISSKDVLLLEHAYADHGHIFYFRIAMFRMLATQFGLSISSPVLRSAMLAYSASALSRRDFADAVYDHTAQALRKISVTIQNPETLDMAAIFAAWLLMQISQIPECTYGGSLAHAEGCVSMLRAFDNVGQGSRSALVTTITPFLWKGARFLATLAYLASGRRVSLPLRRVTYKERVAIWDSLNPFNKVEKRWAPGWIQAMDDLLRDLSMELHNCIGRTPEREGLKFENRVLVDMVLSDVRAEFDDTEFQKSLERLRTFVDTNKESLDAEVADLTLLQLNFVEMGKAVLEAPSLMEGLESVGALASSLMSSYRIRISQNERLRKKYVDVDHVMMAGLVLPLEDADGRKIFCPTRLNLVVRTWAYNLLVELGDESNARYLKCFWEERKNGQI